MDLEAKISENNELLGVKEAEFATLGEDKTLYEKQIEGI
jgi:hypothetical protein